jgi:hypothetical protein
LRANPRLFAEVNGDVLQPGAGLSLDDPGRDDIEADAFPEVERATELLVFPLQFPVLALDDPELFRKGEMVA